MLARSSNGHRLNSDLYGAKVTLAPHRLFPIEDDVAVLAERSTGWCIMESGSYSKLRQYLGPIPVAFDEQSITDQNVLEKLWKGGLLLADGRPHPETLSTYDNIPDSVLLKLTGTCNFACTYCYDFDKEKFGAHLSFERISEVLEFLLSKKEHLSITFHGGEPMLRFGLIQKIVRYAMDTAGDQSRLHFSIQTNASQFSDKVVRYLDAHNFSVGISLDGPDESTNRLRVTRGKGTALQYVKKLLDHFPSFVRERCGFLAVVSRTSAPKIGEFALWLQDWGVNNLSLSFLDNEGRARNLHNEKLDPAEMSKVYMDLVGLVRENHIESLKLKPLISRIANLFELVPRDVCNKGPCGAASDFLALDSDGSLLTCDCTHDPYFLIGKSFDPPNKVLNASQGRQAIVVRHNWLRTSGPECSNCPIFGLCGGTCVAKAILVNGSPFSIDQGECAISKYLYNELLREFRLGSAQALFGYYLKHKSLPESVLG